MVHGMHHIRRMVIRNAANGAQPAAEHHAAANDQLMTQAGAEDGGDLIMAADRRPAAPPPRRGGGPMNRWVVFVALLALTLGLAGGVLFDRQVLAGAVPSDNLPPDAAPAFKLVAEAWSIVDRVYVDRSALQPPRLADGAVAGLVDALGDTGHSRYESAEMARRERDLLQGQFVGIGVELQVSQGRLVVVAPLDGSPAQKAGLRPGDIILRVGPAKVLDAPSFLRLLSIESASARAENRPLELAVKTGDGPVRQISVPPLAE